MQSTARLFIIFFLSGCSGQWENKPLHYAGSLWVTTNTENAVVVQRLRISESCEIQAIESVEFKTPADQIAPLKGSVRYIGFSANNHQPSTLWIGPPSGDVLQLVEVPKVRKSPWKDECAFFPSLAKVVVLQFYQRNSESPVPRLLVFNANADFSKFEPPLELEIDFKPDEGSCEYRLFSNADHNWLCLSSQDGRPWVWSGATDAFEGKKRIDLRWEKDPNGERLLGHYYCDVSMDTKSIASVVTLPSDSNGEASCGVRVASLDSGELLYTADGLGCNGFASCLFLDSKHVLIRRGGFYDYLDIESGHVRQLQSAFPDFKCLDMMLMNNKSTVLMLNVNGAYAIDSIGIPASRVHNKEVGTNPATPPKNE